ncbi:ABC transporter permease subunit [Clavibacter michiganensis]|uniref:ABC transporter permease subunit n=1 Tax=Clavibacter michiganensis TaxID=28447 RepID=UPI0014304E59|nr:ABC transporter permease subunit [Clavibacter michiganensis]MDO4025073.1 ABC transporter permease subunit [Clavibacter michiganensis]MDO4033731.1 ABC transporter permease subunit [Clavibacter michiganensis]MDO4046932.1 ABC transporter permease subunit [Clavibacter michiganensis]MDO4105474.1 ABC transporter permease subunit [Clavibacter michiganensis]MDO4133448.1 ABC transporter permease subunit [Clavibacter michiganensis]
MSDAPAGSRARGGARTLALILAASVVAAALLGPLLPLGSPDEVVGRPFAGPDAAHPLGTELLGRDLLARVAAGGRGLVLEAVAATVAASVAGLALGIWSGLRPSRVADGAVRVVDAVAALPALLVLLVLAAGAPGEPAAIVAAIALVSAPFSVRVIRQQTRIVAAADHVVLARARGDGIGSRLRHDILPGIRSVALADAGLRFIAALQLAAAAGFLGVGASAPAADWGRMVREDVVGIRANVLATLVPAGLLVVVALGVTLAVDASGRRRGAGR